MKYCEGYATTAGEWALRLRLFNPTRVAHLAVVSAVERVVDGVVGTAHDRLSVSCGR